MTALNYNSLNWLVYFIATITTTITLKSARVIKAVEMNGDPGDPMRRRVYKYIGCLALAILLHASAYHLLYSRAPVSPQPSGVRIRVITTQPFQPKVIAKNKTRSTAPSRLSAANNPQISRERRFEAGKPGYQKLFPEEGREFASDAMGQNHGERPLGTKLPPEEQGHLAVLASEMDIPLHWRRYAKSSLATAHLVVREDEAVWCRLLTGEPLLRAVLWTYLQKPAVYAELKKLLRHAEGKDYQIRLRFLPVDGPERSLNFSEESVAYARGVEIIKTLPSPTADFGGVAIENADSRKAKVRDRLALGALYDSPAFNHQIREVKLGKF